MIQKKPKIISPNEARRKRKEEKKAVKRSESVSHFEDGMDYPEVCRIHGIGNPEDLDSALGDYALLAKQLQFFIQIEQPYVQKGELYCPSCKKKIFDGDKYCRECGKRIGWKY